MPQRCSSIFTRIRNKHQSIKRCAKIIYPRSIISPRSSKQYLNIVSAKSGANKFATRTYSFFYIEFQFTVKTGNPYYLSTCASISREPMLNYSFSTANFLFLRKRVIRLLIKMRINIARNRWIYSFSYSAFHIFAKTGESTSLTVRAKNAQTTILHYTRQNRANTPRQTLLLTSVHTTNHYNTCRAKTA